MRVCGVRPDLDCAPPLIGCARVVRNVMLWTFTVAAAATVASLFHRGPDPRLLRAACASKTSADVGRSLLSMTSIPRGSPIVREVYASTERELAAWADVDARCE